MNYQQQQDHEYLQVCVEARASFRTLNMKNLAKCFKNCQLTMKVLLPGRVCQGERKAGPNLLGISPT